MKPLVDAQVPYAMLIAFGHARHTWRAIHANDDGFIRGFRRMELANVLRDFKGYFDMVHAGSENLMDAKILEGPPVAELNRSIDERNFYAVVQGFLLLFWKFGTEIRNHHVPAGHDDGLCSC